MSKLLTFAIGSILATTLVASNRGAHAADHLFVLTSNFTTQGNCAALQLESPWPASVDLEPVGVHASVRSVAGLHYVVNGSPADNLQIVDGTSFATVRTLFFDSGSNPRDVLVVGDGTAYVSFYDRAILRRIHLVTGALVASVDLGAFADADGLPEMESMARDGGRLFVQLQRLDRTATPETHPGLLAVVDLVTNRILDVDPGTPGPQAIQLAWTNPRFPMTIEGRRLYVAELGSFNDQAGGIEPIDLDALEPLGLEFVEKEMGLGQMGGFVFVSPTKGYVLHHTDLLQSSHLVSFSRTTGTFLSEHFVSFGLTETVAFDPETNLLFFPDNWDETGVRVFAAANGAALTPTPISTGLPAVQCVVARAASTGAGWPAGTARLLPVPNPMQDGTTIHFAPGLSGTTVEIFDVRGARIRRLERGASGRGLFWNGRDETNRPVASGTYFVQLLGSGDAASAARLQVVR